jgi:hypothetical protein
MSKPTPTAKKPSRLDFNHTGIEKQLTIDNRNNSMKKKTLTIEFLMGLEINN